MNLKGGNLIFKYVIVCLLVMFAIVHDIELFSLIVMYLEFNIYIFKYEFPLKNKENMFHEPIDISNDLVVMCKNWEEVSELGRKRVKVTIFLPILLKMNM